ncbi:hypothetical protein CDEST_00440 [Colletotrichum destructivum]|uniref:Uncharacterized protein n=1 Tax=Colletotrichum destructivum TaxID=34406 RepID=A0AAX4HW81_9PEZI|nr:hypothetical protein CDEST_00440 [Colletotrichum destructivum]
MTSVRESRTQARSKELPRLRFDDFSYESRISGPQSPKRPPPPRHRASWAFPLRRGPGFTLDSSPSTAPDTDANTTSTVSSGASPIEPPPSGIMKTMEFQLSYESRTWTRRGKTFPQGEGLPLRPSTISDMRSITSGNLEIFCGGASTTSLNIDTDARLQRESHRHSSPPASSWSWLANGHSRPVSMNGVVKLPLEPTAPIAHEKQ